MGQASSSAPLPLQQPDSEAPPHSTASVMQLAEVELQIVMHGLEIKEMIQFARCSRRLMRMAVSSPFAWRYALLPVTTPVALSSLAHSLLRHAALSLSILAGHPTVQLNSLRPVLRSGVRIRALDAIHAPHSRWCHFVLSHASVRDIHTLHLHTLEECMVELIVALPLLRTLSVVRASGGPAMWSDLLPRMASLTELRVETSHQGLSSAALPVLPRCRTLTRLALHDLPLQGPLFLEFSISAAMQRLELLHIDCFFAEELTAALPNVLRSLHCLHLSRCWGVDALLARLAGASAPALRRLIVQPCCVVMAQRDRSSVPSMPMVQQLLLAAPQLRVLVILPTAPSAAAAAVSKQAANNSLKLQRTMATAMRLFGAAQAARFRIAAGV